MKLSSFIVATALCFISFSCRKDVKQEPEISPSKDKQHLVKRAGSNDNIIQKIEAWLTLKSNESPKKAEVIASLRQNLDYGSLRIEQLNAEEDVVVVPISTIQTDNYQNAINNLVVKFDKLENISYLNIVQFLPRSSTNFTSLREGTFANLLNRSYIQDGRFAFLNLADKLMYELSIERNSLISYSSRSWQPEQETQNCVTLWKVHTDVYIDHIEQDWELLGTFCNTDETDKGGTGGNNGSLDDICSKPLDQDAAQSVANSAVNGQLTSWITDNTLSSYIDANGVPTKEKTPEWEFYKGNMTPLHTFYYTAYFKGTAKKYLNTWKWVTQDDPLNGITRFKYVSHNRSGNIPTCTSVSCSMNNWSVNFSNENITANVSISYTISATVPCFFGVEMRTESHTQPSSFDANE